MPRRREIMLAIAAMAVGIGAFLVLAEIVLRFLPVASGLRTQAVTETSPVFRLAPNRDYVYSRDWDLAMVNRGRVNNAGFVNRQDYARDSALPVLAIVGDSYVEALMVPFAETMQGRLAKALQGKLRVYSFAASGAPLSQYLIWARHAARDYGAKALIVNVVGNDFDESHVDHRVASGFWLYAPGANGALRLALFDYTPGLARQMIAHSALARYLVFNLGIKKSAGELEAALRGLFSWASPSAPQYAGNTTAAADDTRVKNSLAVIDAFFRDLPEMTGLPAERIAFTLDGFRYPSAGGENTYFGRMRREFAARAQANGYEVIDIDPMFQEHYRRNRQRFEFPRDGHWNAVAHGVAAEAALDSRLLKALGR
ncbi:MAG: hypothetical protein ACT4N4_17710 [Rhodospirillales bacterium]